MKISFCHYGNPKMASYRYRAQIPARELGADINNPDADIIIFAKPIDQDVRHIMKAKAADKKVIADFCDMHFHLDCYKVALQAADAVTVPTRWFADWIAAEHGIEAHVVPDPYEYPLLEPHCAGNKLMWFGHGLNIDSLARVLPLVDGYPLTIVSNLDGAVPWSPENMLRELSAADIVVMPETAPYKSANRTLEAIRQGCFVVAEPHPAINDIPGIWIGNIKKGIEWATQNQQQARERTTEAQSYVEKWYSPRTLGSAWRTVIQKVQSSSTSDAVMFAGLGG